ncbi:response regulator [Rhodocaloribacter sp.]
MENYSILIVDDEESIQDILGFYLGETYEVRMASDGEEALERIAEHAPDLIISDIMMPRMSGVALHEALQTRETTRAIPFIFLTALADDQGPSLRLRPGVDDYITKPFDFTQLRVRVDRLLERARLSQERLDVCIGEEFSQRLKPERWPEAPGFRIFAQDVPNGDRGGNLLDWMQDASGAYYFIIGNVWGKGLRARFYAFSFLAYVRSVLHAMRETAHTPAELIRRVNEVLIEDPPMEDTLASVTLIRWDPAQNRVIYAGCGHYRPVLVTELGVHALGHDRSFLGVDPDAVFTDTWVGLQPRSALAVYPLGIGAREVEADLTNALADLPPSAAMIDRLTSRDEAGEAEDLLPAFWLERLPQS